MDPSNNNSFGSFGNNAGAGNGASVGGASAGAGIGSGVTITSPNAGATNSGSIVSSGATAVNNYSSKNFPDGGITIGGGENRSRKGLVIAGVVFFVLAIGGGLAALAAMSGVFGGGNGGNGGGGEGGTPSVVIDENVSMDVAFNRYANYLVSGEVKDEVVDLSVFDERIVFDEKYTDKVFVENASKLFDVFYRKEGEKMNHEDGKNVFDRSMDDWNFLNDGLNVIVINNEELQEKFLKNGETGAISYLNDYYSIKEEDSSEIMTLKNYLIKKGEILVEFWKYYKERGCLSGDYYDEDCVSNIPESDLNELALELGDVDDSIFRLYYDSMSDIEEQVIDYLGGAE